MTEHFLVSFLKDQSHRVIDVWMDRLREHPEALYDRMTTTELEPLCDRGLEAILAFLQGYPEPSLKEFVWKFVQQKAQWNLEALDVIRFFWEFRSAVIVSVDQGGDAGVPDWKTLYEQLDPLVEAGILHAVQSLGD